MSARTLAEAISDYGPEAYLLTVGKDGPHTTPVSVRLDGEKIDCAIGPSAARNIASVPNVSLFWPPRDAGGYAMFVNGIATGVQRPDGGHEAAISLTKSVLHRSGPRPADGTSACESDCKRLAR
ncbi:MAG: hypothetical protein AB7L90_08640 [Hyphomicrobiaceae bacterium]